jgi:medium-chain acyl-[acyl-carrier-protein] hydrolase
MNGRPPRRDPWFVRRRGPRAEHPPLYCLPYAGGSASVYSGWAQTLAGVADVAAVQLPGREYRIAEHASVDPLAIAAAISQDTSGPFALFGHSMGALLAFEVATEFTRRGEPHRLTHLFVSGSAEPRIPRLVDLPADPADDELAGWLRKMGNTDPRVLDSPMLLELLLPVLRADLTWVKSYPGPTGPRLSCPVTAFAGDQDIGAAPAAVAGWEACTDGPFALRVVPGGHFFLHPERDTVLADIAASLRADP